MWEKFKRITINRDHTIVIPRACQPGQWFGAGDALLAPLYRRRNLLIEKENLIFAWTLYNKKLLVSDWITPPDANEKMHYLISISINKPSGWRFTIPKELRDKGWLPGSGEIVVCEYSDSEMNFWTQRAYNLESILEADEP